ncbi:hypothetical protein FLONG3_6776 [Fusarium longipes]|uniref:Uncharacterized protein n=1 Tax=Fusarium longipes TaxID=694270 RepID=A0A395SIX5_9HYPO|nr:hypothetical protein FLONG3_6776 [Fusarium longipes]
MPPRKSAANKSGAGLKNEDSPKWHHNFKSLKRIFNENNEHPTLKFPDWVDAGRAAKEHRDKYNYPKGVLINFRFKASMGVNSELTQYLAFKGILEMNSYVDTIVADIVQHAALVAHHHFAISKETFDTDVTMPLNDDLAKIMDNINPDDNTSFIMRPSPLDLLTAYVSDEDVRMFVDKVAKLCTKPTLVPVLNKHVYPQNSDNGERDEISCEAFVLVHAVQILLFAPMAWVGSIPYTRDTRDYATYAHRFPTPQIIGGGTEKDVANMFSLEDLHRSICMFYQLITRRNGRTNWMGRRAPYKQFDPMEFAGYVNPDLIHLATSLDAVDSDITLPESAQTGRAEAQVQNGSNTIPLEETGPILKADLLAKIDLIELNDASFANIELVSCVEWASQISAEVALPDWMTDELREICIFELIKSSWSQPFNRYAWVVERDAQGGNIEYHSNDNVRLGHVFSLVAKIALDFDCEQDREFWVSNAGYLIDSCRSVMDRWKTPEEIEVLLSYTRGQLMVPFFGPFYTATVAVKGETDEAKTERRERVSEGVRKRAEKTRSLRLMEPLRARIVNGVLYRLPPLDDDDELNAAADDATVATGEALPTAATAQETLNNLLAEARREKEQRISVRFDVTQNIESYILPDLSVDVTAGAYGAWLHWDPQLWLEYDQIVEILSTIVMFSLGMPNDSAGTYAWLLPVATREKNRLFSERPPT